MEELSVGRISHFFHKINVAVIELTHPLKVGDKIRIVGHGADFTQTVDSMQVEHASLEHADIGQSIGLRVREHTKPGCNVYLVKE